MAAHLPIIEPCERSSNFKVRCVCGWRARQRFTIVQGAEAFWVSQHAALVVATQEA